jgi:hypothetical protein
VVVLGPSRTGKTTLPVLHFAALTGYSPKGKPWTPDLFRHHPAEILATSTNGTEIRRTWTEGPKGLSQELAIKGKPSTQAKLSELVDLYVDPVVTRAVLLPWGWTQNFRALVLGTARESASASDRATDAACLEVIKASPDWEAGDPESLTKTTDLRRATQRKADGLAGEYAAACRVLEDLEAEPVQATAEAMATSRVIIEQQDAWDRYQTELSAWRTWDTYSRQLMALGTEPPDVSSDLTTAQAEREDCTRRWTTAHSSRVHADREAWEARKIAERLPEPDPRLTVVRALVASLSAVGDTCPTCGRGGCGDHLPVLQAEGEALEAEHRAAVEAHKDRHRKMTLDAAAATTQAGAEEDSAESAVSSAKTEVQRLTTAQAYRSRWLESRARLVKPAEVARPQPMERPDPATVEGARLLVSASPVDEALLGDRRRRRTLASAEVERIQQSHTAILADAARLGRLEDAWKTAPRRLLPDAVVRFNGLLHESVKVRADGDTVEVLVHGRTIGILGQTSGGERVLADACVRAAIRDRYGLKLPVYVDEAQTWNDGSGVFQSWVKTNIAGLVLLQTGEENA